MGARCGAVLIVLLGLGPGAACSLLFPFGAAPEHDAGAPADAASDGQSDASTIDLTCDVPFAEVGGEYAHCLGCRIGCNDRRPFCCLFQCCAEECGTVDNDCSTDPPPPRPDAGPDGDADADGDADGDGDCDGLFLEHDVCLGCNVPCPDDRPFCCGAKCCAEECGAVPNTCLVHGGG